MKYYQLLSILLFIGCQHSKEYPSFKEETSPLRDDALAPFYHGVASGDPLFDRVIIWTRVTPKDSLPEIEVTWQVALENDFAGIISSGTEITDPSKDYTVKVDVEGLEAEKSYYYRFIALNDTSIIGKTRTAAVNADSVRFGIVSCSNYEFGYFNGYARLADEQLDAIVHLGDYIYEYGPGTYGDSTTGRRHLPANEIITLNDYRTRYSQYRLDPDLRAAHANHPFIAVWDDHEIVNNSYVDGAQNHQEGEGNYDIRKQIAAQVYYEWLPIRAEGTLYRKFRYGNLAELIMLDERLEGRTKQAEGPEDPSLNDPERSMLGDQQMEWLQNSLVNSSALWKVIGNQVIYSYLDWGHETFHLNMDSWDGYPGDQSALAKAINENDIKNIIFITGDTHSAWAFEATHDPFDTYDSQGAFAVEFGTTSITSGNSNERFADSLVIDHEKKIVNSEINPHLKYANLRDHGYLVLTLTSEKAVAQWFYLKTLKERSKKLKEVKEVWVKAGTTTLMQ